MKDTKIPASFVEQINRPIDNTHPLLPPIESSCAHCGDRVLLGGGVMQAVRLRGGSNRIAVHALVHPHCAEAAHV